ncbi:MAG TPA: hypothetical protein VFZ25_09575 [Chloroflexota bacterium]|nr:hypothetical protein [Chloroflexota bacterium]
MSHELARKSVKLRRTGGSRSAVIPKEWLEETGIVDEAELVLTEEGILLLPPERHVPSIEDEPEFAAFLAFLAKDALAHPERLGDVGELVAEDADLFDDVDDG